jgi:hypothetical protein
MAPQRKFLTLFALRGPVLPSPVESAATVNNDKKAPSPELQRGRRVFTFPMAILAIIIGKAFWTCRGRIVDTDLWWHLRNGESMLAQAKLPAMDAYSFTAAGSPWLDHSWASELLYYAGYRAFGLQGIFVIFTLATAALLVSLFCVCRRRAQDPLAAGICAIWGGLLAMVGFTPRAQNFGWLCFIAVFAILLRFRDEKRAPLWVLPILFCLWINFHGSWPVGLVVFGIVAGAGLIHRDIGQLTASPWTPPERRRLLLTFVCSVAALFINPLSFHLVLYPFDLLFKQNLNVTIGGEWASVNFNDSRGLFVMVTVSAVLAFALSRRRAWRIDDVALLAFALFCGLTHIRLLVITGCVVPAILVSHFGRISTYNPEHERNLLNAGILVAVAAIIILGFPTEQDLSAQVEQFFPAGAANYLRDHPVAGKMFNEYEWGGYLEWALPQTRTFIDTRTEIFEYSGVLRDYVAISTFERTEELFDQYDISYVIYPNGTPLSYFLSKSARWRCLYEDKLAIVYTRPAAAEASPEGCSARSLGGSALP